MVGRQALHLEIVVRIHDPQPKQRKVYDRMQKIQKNAKAVMYRIIPVLAAFCLVLALAVPTRAAETTNELYNVLDYASANGSGSNYFSYYSPETVVYDLPAAKFISYVDIVLWSVGELDGIAVDMPEDTYYEAVELAAQLIYHVPNTDYYLYRVYGNIGFARFHAIELTFYNPVFDTKEYYAEIIQFDVGTMANGYPISVENFMAEGYLVSHQLDETTNDLGITLYGKCEDEPAHTAPALVNLYTVGYMYDRLIFYLYDFGGGFSDFSVMATNFEGEYIPCGTLEYQLLSGEAEYEWGDGAAVYVVSVDLSDVNLADDAIVQITFLAYPKNNEWNIGFDGFTGYMNDNTTDSEYPYYYGIVGWLQKIWNSITDGFDRVIEGIEDLTGIDLTGQDSADEFNDKIDSLKPGMDEDIKDLNNVDKPDASDVKTDANDLVGAEGMQQATNIMVVLTANPIVSGQLVAVCSVMLIGYALYGKRD